MAKAASMTATAAKPQDSGNRRTNPSLSRVTVNLTSRSVRALEDTVAATGDSQTDTINRALQVYAYLEQVIEAGGGVYTREGPGKDLVSLRFF